MNHYQNCNKNLYNNPASTIHNYGGAPVADNDSDTLIVTSQSKNKNICGYNEISNYSLYTYPCKSYAASSCRSSLMAVIIALILICGYSTSCR